MPFVIVIAGALVIVAAFMNTQGDLGRAIEADLPGYFKWGAAIAAILALGYVPGLKTPSRWLLALVILVIFLRNYSQVLSGFTSFAGSGATPTSTASDSPAPATTFAATPAQGAQPTATQIAGDASTGSGSTSTSSPLQVAQSAANQIALNPSNPSSYVAALSSIESGFGAAFG